MATLEGYKKPVREIETGVSRHLPSMPILGHLGCEGQTFFYWAQRYVPDLLMILSKILTGITLEAPSWPLGMRA